MQLPTTSVWASPRTAAARDGNCGLAVADLHEPTLDERAQRIIHRAQADVQSLPQLPLGQFRVLVQQAQDLEPRHFLYFSPFFKELPSGYRRTRAADGWGAALDERLGRPRAFMGKRG